MAQTTSMWPGTPYPMGATYDGTGTNFSVYSSLTDRVELCLFDDAGRETRLDLLEVNAGCWHGYLPGIGPGQRYGYRAHGPYFPQGGLRCNPPKLLLDPYGKAVEGQVGWGQSVFPYTFGQDDLSRNDDDSAAAMPRSVVIDPSFDWEGDTQLRTPWNQTVVYETHVKGFTRQHPDVAPELRGTYAGLGSDAAIDHLTRLGVTAVELLPVHQFVQDDALLDRGLRNYWGYNSLCFLAPHNEYSATGQRGQQVTEFKQMVKRLHAAGIEVILDVVFNHTAEGNHLGPVLSFKGIDNPAYYRLVSNDPRYYMDYTGTGNSINAGSVHALQLIMDSLRYWILEMHVDGFRFDLATVLARDVDAVNQLSAFFSLIQQDPFISQVKLIAEPWDVGLGGYQVGNFPFVWSEWNGRYRDNLRDYWRSIDGTLSEFAYRFTGSSDLYQADPRSPWNSVNFVTAHDGFTLADLVSYNDKHNEANGEGNRDGSTDNRAWNCGVEGLTDDADVLALRARQQRNFLATLILSQGIPMLLGGDEFGRTQQGNNNGYCQDNELSWFDWSLVEKNAELLDFTRRVISLRCGHTVFHRAHWFQGVPIQATGIPDIGWFTPSGAEMSDLDWAAGWNKAVGVFLNGDALRDRTPQGQRIVDDSFLVLFNADWNPITFTLPDGDWGRRWRKVLDTNDVQVGDDGPEFDAGSQVVLEARSMVLIRRVDPGPAAA
ncbi:MAG: glycogen debranching protein GlgX [Mycobacterium leprae]